MFIVLAEERFGLETTPPGSSCIRSARDEVCMWSMAVREIVEAVDCPALLALAVTTTSSSRKLSAFMTKLSVRSAVTLIVVSTGT